MKPVENELLVLADRFDCPGGSGFLQLPQPRSVNEIGHWPRHLTVLSIDQWSGAGLATRGKSSCRRAVHSESNDTDGVRPRSTHCGTDSPSCRYHPTPRSLSRLYDHAIVVLHGTRQPPHPADDCPPDL